MIKKSLIVLFPGDSSFRLVITFMNYLDSDRSKNRIENDPSIWKCKFEASLGYGETVSKKNVYDILYMLFYNIFSIYYIRFPPIYYILHITSSII